MNAIFSKSETVLNNPREYSGINLKPEEAEDLESNPGDCVKPI